MRYGTQTIKCPKQERRAVPQPSRGRCGIALGKKLRLVVVSAKDNSRGRVYRIARPA